MRDLLENLSTELKIKAYKESQTPWVEPMLATLTQTYFSDPNWIYECKLDGVRTLIHKEGHKVHLYSRNKKLQNHSFPDLVEAIEKLESNFILDGEIVTFEDNISSFSKLQPRLHVKNPSQQLITQVPIYLYIFDILYIDGYRVDELPLLERKKILEEAFAFKDPLRYLEHRVQEGEAYLKEVCEKGWEGLIAKDATAVYEHKRSKKWLKFKCIHQQELVIAGYTEPQGSRIGFGALLVGYYEGNKLKYAGRVGTGFDAEFLERFYQQMVKIQQDQCPFDNFNENEEGIHWLKPHFVGEVGFAEWTSAGKLRHPRFLGLRSDKPAKDVVKED